MMSCTSPSILLGLLFLAAHACAARPIGNNENEPGKSSDFSVKNEEKSSLAGVYAESNPTIPEKSESAEIDSSLMQNDKVNNDTQSRFAKYPLVKKEEKSDQDERSKVEADAVKPESTANVYWNSADEPQGQEEEPWYNVDYAPPKTHPPHHN